MSGFLYKKKLPSLSNIIFVHQSISFHNLKRYIYINFFKERNFYQTPFQKQLGFYESLSNYNVKVREVGKEKEKHTSNIPP